MRFTLREKVLVFTFILVRIFPHSDWIWTEHIQSECGEIRIRITSYTDTFYAVLVIKTCIPKTTFLIGNESKFISLSDTVDLISRGKKSVGSISFCNDFIKLFVFIMILYIHMRYSLHKWCIFIQSFMYKSSICYLWLGFSKFRQSSNFVTPSFHFITGIFSHEKVYFRATQADNFFIW